MKNFALTTAAIAASVVAGTASSGHAADATKTVPGPSISVQANWNQTNDARVEYDAPQGWHVVSARFIVDSAANQPSYNFSLLGNKAVFTAQAHGSGKFFDQYRGWFSAHTEVTISEDGAR